MLLLEYRQVAELLLGAMYYQIPGLEGRHSPRWMYHSAHLAMLARVNRTLVSPAGPHFHLAEVVIQTKGERLGAQLIKLKLRLKLGGIITCAFVV